MSETSRPWNGITIGDAGPYTDAQWQTLYRAIIGLGANRSNVGIFLGSGTQPNDGLRVTEQSPTTAAVNVGPGAALVHGVGYISDAIASVVIAGNASGNPRVDTIVLRADYALQTIRLAIKAGTPAASPVPPALTQVANVMWEIPVADIAVANGFSAISQSNITPRHEWVNAAAGVYLDSVLNNSGSVLEDGQVVVWDNTGTRAVTTTSTRDNKNLAGVVRGRIENGAYGRVQIKGIGYVRTNAAAAIGNLLTTSSTVAQAAVVTAGSNAIANASIGRVIETSSGAGLVLTNINVHIVRNVDWVVVQDQKTTNVAGGATVSGAWTTHILNAEVLDTANIASVAANRVNLQPGFYTAVWHVTWGTNPGNTRTRLRDITGTATLGQSPNAVGTASSNGSTEFLLTVASDIELQYYVTAAQASGLGLAVNTGDVEVYASVTFIRHAETP